MIQRWSRSIDVADSGRWHCYERVGTHAMCGEQHCHYATYEFEPPAGEVSCTACRVEIGTRILKGDVDE